VSSGAGKRTRHHRPRILTKNYSNAFLRGLPNCPAELV
jgi:hypothetical protein